MKQKNKYNRIVAAMIVAILGLSFMQTAQASSVTDAQNKKTKAQSDLNSVNNNISDIESQQSDLQTQIDALDAELVNIILNMDILEGELADKQTQLDEVNVELADAQEQEESQYVAMKKRIQFMYENGDSNFFEVILGADNMTDFLNRVEYASAVYDYDRKLLTTYQETKQQVADLKTQVEGDKAELEEMQVAYEAQETDYENMIASKKSSMDNFDSQLAEAKTLATQYQSTIEQQNVAIQEAAAKQAADEAAAKKNASKADTSTKADNSTKEDTSTKTDTSTSAGSNPGYSTSVSGGDVVAYACKFIGNPYVSGGISLTDGCDCSGYVMSVYANFGISLPHSSAALQSCGSEVSYSNAQPGDLICYAGHVAIYMGNGQIVNASSSAPYPIGGIKTNVATYRSIMTVRRVL